MFLANREADHGHALEPVDAECLGGSAPAMVLDALSRYVDVSPTPLLLMPRLAGELGIGALAVKNESSRLGLGSFKALGGAYAVIRLARERAVKGERLTVACATAGNHGRSVAFGARLVGARAVVFVHERVSEARVEGLRELDADVVRVPGVYDDAVGEAARRAAESGWAIVSDTAWPEYEQVPRMVMQGYTVLMQETLAGMTQPPTHVFVQAGVGGLAASVTGHLREVLGSSGPTVVVVEPERAACLLASARAGWAVTVARAEATVMTMLECYKPSLTAWRILMRSAEAFMTVSDEEAMSALRRLAQPVGGDPSVSTTPSGAAGLAGLLRAAGNPAIRAALALDAKARVLTVVTE